MSTGGIEGRRLEDWQQVATQPPRVSAWVRTGLVSQDWRNPGAGASTGSREKWTRSLLTRSSGYIMAALCMHAKSPQSCHIICNPVNCSPPGSSVHGILKARILEWVAISKGIFLTPGLNSCLLHLLHWQADSLWLAPPGKLVATIVGKKMLSWGWHIPVTCTIWESWTHAGISKKSSILFCWAQRPLQF